MFAAAFGLGPDPGLLGQVDETAILRAIDPFRQSDDRGTWRGQYGVVAQATIWNTPESTSQSSPHTCPATGRIVGSWTRLDNRDELSAQLGLSGARSPLTDARLLAAAYDRWGYQCTDHLVGAFSFSVFDPKSRNLFVARDPMGVRPLFYAYSGGLFTLSTTAAAFRHMPGLALEPSLEWMARFLTRTSMSHTDTAWPPASEWIDEYRQVLNTAVQCRLSTTFPLGVETTGGIDSSTCLAVAALLWDGSTADLHSYGFVHAEQEPDFIYDTGQLHQIDNQHIIEHPKQDHQALADRALQVLGYPVEQGNALGHVPFYEHCQSQGVRTLLSGFGGDEGVTSEARLLYAELLDQRRYRALWRSLADEPRARPVRLAKVLADSHRRARGRLGFAAGVREQWQWYALRADVVQRFDLDVHFYDTTAHDTGYTSINEFIVGRRLGGAEVPTRLENCTLMAQSYQVEYRWPLLDQRLIQQYLSTPSIHKRGQGLGRFLHRQAVQGAVPEKIRLKPNKNMGAPLRSSAPLAFTRQVHDALDVAHPLVHELIDAPRLRAVAHDLDNGPANKHSPAIVPTVRLARNVRVLSHWLDGYHS